MRQGTTVQGHPRRVSARSFRARSLKLAAVMAVAALGAAACSGDPAPEPSGVGAETPTILATTGIWADVVANVACNGLAQVESIIPVGGDPHGYEPSLQDRARMENAALVVANGLLLEEALEDTLDAVEESGTPVFRFAEGMDPIPYGFETGHDDHDDEGHEDDHDDHEGHDHDDEGHEDDHDDHEGHDHDDEGHEDDHDDHEGHDHDDEGHEDDHDDHEGHDHDDEGHEDDHDEEGHEGHDHDEEGHEDDHDDHAHEDDGHGHAHGAEDPHVWFDPHRVAEALPTLAQVLTTEVGLDQAAVEACLNSYVAELEAVDAEIAAKVEQLPAGSHKLVTNHEALGYFADRYGFEVIGTVIPSPSSMAQTSPAGLEALAEIIEHERIKAIFAETQHSVDDIEALAARVGDVDVVTLYTGSLGPAGSGADTYTGFLRTNTDLIVDALG
ncbi:MAG: metal ABC transporter substrate-binding protein [Acidimicrobiaceae bacterium]|nr:metal ABC transporter substrate-binding protein [Acidimicrobiaceae bacterium]